MARPCSLHAFSGKHIEPQPDYIPKSIRDDYHEACLILQLSPKASATLSRRCLQGMIRDYCGIAKGRLIDEINALRSAIDSGQAPPGVTLESVEAMDKVRSIGNIGAHMEKDIDVIIAVDPGEAQLLVELIEMLFEEWYVARHKRQSRLQAIRELAENKERLKAGSIAKALPVPDTDPVGSGE